MIKVEVVYRIFMKYNVFLCLLFDFILMIYMLVYMYIQLCVVYVWVYIIYMLYMYICIFGYVLYICIFRYLFLIKDGCFNVVFDNYNCFILLIGY